MKTYTTKLSHVQPRWHVFDAADRTLGRMATEISVLLQGKHNPHYARHLLTGDYVVVINAAKVRVTGNNKPRQKTYYRHSHYSGGLRQVTLAQMQEKYPERVIKAAVWGMLPQTTLGRHMLRRLKVYAGNSHPHQAQVRTLAVAEVPASVLHAQEDDVSPEPAAVQEETADDEVEEQID
ncbi:MAG: 50S ribosomal protein L13 [Chloroflexi bacterium]|nr:50S ribosomal protein L13 [Chloroflexota bacterium]